MNKAKSVKWLVDNGADLNDEDNPSFLLAVRYCDEPLIRYLISQGAKTDVLIELIQMHLSRLCMEVKLKSSFDRRARS